MFFGKSISVTAQTKQVVPFVCASCGYSARAEVVGIGTGTNVSPYYLAQASARAGAVSDAEKRAQRNLAATLAQAVCPGCGRRDTAAIRRVVALEILRSLGVGALVGGLLYFFIHTRSAPPPSPGSIGAAR